MFAHLPPEILLNILSSFNVQTMHSLQLVSRAWNTFIIQYQSALYHSAAVVHNFVPPDTKLSDVRKIYPGPWLSGLKSWKDYCQRWFKLERNWEGKGSAPSDGPLPLTGQDCHRFKLDEENRLVVTTHGGGGLRVCCMDTGELLFELTKNYVRRYAHCEYGKGFLVFDRLHPHALEIWRLITPDWNGDIPSEPPTRTVPDDSMRQAADLYTYVTTTGPVNPGRGRGRFAPWALFEPPHNPRAYRFVFPTLLVGSEEGNELYLFDVPSARLAQTLPLPRTNGEESEGMAHNGDAGAVEEGADDQILYVELSPRHVFVCTTGNVVIIPRELSARAGRRPVFFPRDDPRLQNTSLLIAYSARLRYKSENNVALSQYFLDIPAQPSSTTTALVPAGGMQEFYAVHASASGEDFVAVTWLGLAYIVVGFERAMRGEKTFSEITQIIHLEAPARNLAFDYGRAVIQTHKGVLIISTDSSSHNVIGKPAINPFPIPKLLPHITIHQLERFRNKLALQLVSCVKLTRTGIWLDWSMRAYSETNANGHEVVQPHNARAQQFADRVLFYVDFAPSPPT